MTRRTRSAALFSTAALLAGASFSLVFAGGASAAGVSLGTLSVDDPNPTAGQTIKVSGTGCLNLDPLPTSSAPAPDAAPAAAAADVTPAAAASPSDAAPVAAPTDDPGDDDAPGEVSITITGPNGFSSGDTATASPDGTWDGDNGIQLGDAGDYQVDATCTVLNVLPTGDAGAAAAGSVTFDYDTLDLVVAAAPVVLDPKVNCIGCTNANPGDAISLTGTGFPASQQATLSLPGYDDVVRTIDSDGGFSGASFTIAADQVAGTLDGTVSAPGIDPVAFSVAVTVPDQPADVDGPTTPTDTGDTDGTDGTDVSTGTDYPAYPTSSAPTLPNTGVDSAWPGVIGGLLVLSGGALVWAGRRRDEAATTAV